MNFREFAEKMLEYGFGLKGVNFGGHSFKYALKGGLIGQYAEYYIISGTDKNGKPIKNIEKQFWEVDFHSDSVPQNMWDIILTSEEFVKKAQNLQNGNVRLKDCPKEDWPYYEHIEPKSYMYNRFVDAVNSGKTLNARDILRHAKVVGLSRDENKILDGSGQKFDVNDYNLIRNDWSKVMAKNDVEETLDSMKNIRGNLLSTKDNGTAYARLAHLVNNGVKFVWGADPTQSSSKSQEEIIRDYLENKFYTYDYTNRKWC